MDIIRTYGELMEEARPALYESSPLALAVQGMQNTYYRALPVLKSANGEIAGVVRQRALLAAFAKGLSPSTPAGQLLEPAPLLVSPDEVWDFESGKHEIIMVAQAGRLLGVVHPHLLEDHLLPQVLFLFGTLLEAIPYPIVAVNDQGVVWLCNEAFSQLMPGGRAGIINRHLNEVITESQLYKVVQSGRVEKWKKLKFGERSFLVNRAPLIVHGKHIGALASLHDVSELEQISNELLSVRMLTEELNGIIESSFDGIYVTDGEGKTLRVNKAYERISGLRASDVVGYTMQELVEQHIFDQSSTIGVLATKAPCTVIQKIRGNTTVMASGTPVYDNAGQMVRVVTTVRDLTELNNLRDKLEAADTLKVRYEEELRELKHKLGQDENSPSAHSPAMQHVLALALRLGSVDSTVLIQGESGVGKEWIAGIIHNNSNRQGKPFIKVNCAAIPEALLESELFGYIRGAFTGASKTGKSGLFEAAEGGTILLDEIGDVPLSLQVKLLRVLQERQTRRVGDTHPRDIDVRIIAATNHNLAGLVETGRFRQDLFYRLNVVPIVVPPLRERREDIVFMAQQFLQKFCQRHSRKKELHPSTLPMLAAYSWPGNVRELENLMERLVVTSLKPIIGVDDLPASMRQAELSSYQISLNIEGKSLKEILDMVEAKTLQQAFIQHKSTRKVAKALNIDQSSVVRKSKKLNLFTLATQ